jgi:hypothetical protein
MYGNCPSTGKCHGFPSRPPCAHQVLLVALLGVFLLAGTCMLAACYA